MEGTGQNVSGHAVDIDPQTLPAWSGAHTLTSMAKTDTPGHHWMLRDAVSSEGHTAERGVFSIESQVCLKLFQTHQTLF